MLFNTTSRLSSKLSQDQVKATLVGKHVQFKGLDFEVKESDGMLKVIPHTENDEKARIPPITHIEMETVAGGTKLTVTSKPRRIDIGGLYMVASFIVLILLIAVYVRFTYPEQSIWNIFVLIGISLLIFIIFRMRLQSSYYGYISGIRSFIKKQVA